MNHESACRIALVIVAAAHLLVSWGRLHRAGAGGADLVARAEGPWLAAGTGLVFVAFCVTATLRLVHPDWLPWLAFPVASPLRWSGLPIMIAGAGLHLWGMAHLGPNLTVTIGTRAEHRLVTTGPYRWIRHPLYAGGMIESAGACLLLGSGFVAVSAGVFWLLVHLRTSREETLLRATFGVEYTRYSNSTGRYLPRCSRLGKRQAPPGTQ